MKLLCPSLRLVSIAMVGKHECQLERVDDSHCYRAALAASQRPAHHAHFVLAKSALASVFPRQRDSEVCLPAPSKFRHVHSLFVP